MVSTVVNTWSIHGDYLNTNDWRTFSANPQQWLQYKQGTRIIATTPYHIQRTQFRGTIYSWDTFTCTGFTTILPPNSIGVTNYDGDWGNCHIMPPDSMHPGGVNGLMCDGSCRFISETIDTGNLGATAVQTGKSPYGVWGAMGSKSGGEPITLP